MAFQNVMNMDIRLRFVPVWLINYLTRKIVWFAFDAFRVRAAEWSSRGLPAAYQERLAKHSDLYDDVRSRLERVTPCSRGTEAPGARDGAQLQAAPAPPSNAPSATTGPNMGLSH